MIILNWGSSFKSRRSISGRSSTTPVPTPLWLSTSWSSHSWRILAAIPSATITWRYSTTRNSRWLAVTDTSKQRRLKNFWCPSSRSTALGSLSRKETKSKQSPYLSTPRPIASCIWGRHHRTISGFSAPSVPLCFRWMSMGRGAGI